MLMRAIVASKYKLRSPLLAAALVCAVGCSASDGADTVGESSNLSEGTEVPVEIEPGASQDLRLDGEAPFSLKLTRAEPPVHMADGAPQAGSAIITVTGPNGF